MPAATSSQLTDIATAIAKVDAYVKVLLEAQNQAAMAGDLSLVQQLTGPYLDANALEERLVALRSMADIASLAGAIASIKQTTATLNKQKTQIDKTVKAVGTAATVINTIAQIVAAVAKL